MTIRDDDTLAKQPAQQHPDLSHLRPETQEAIRGWIKDGIFFDRAIGAMHDQEQRLMAYEKAQQQEPVAFSQFLSDVVTAAGLLSHGKTDKSLAARISEFAFRLRTSPQPAQRKPLTDDPLQGAVDWLLEADGEYFCTATVQRTLRIGYNRAKRLCDTAKERAANGIKGDA